MFYEVEREEKNNNLSLIEAYTLGREFNSAYMDYIK